MRKNVCHYFVRYLGKIRIIREISGRIIFLVLFYNSPDDIRRYTTITCHISTLWSLRLLLDLLLIKYAERKASLYWNWIFRTVSRISGTKNCGVTLLISNGASTKYRYIIILRGACWQMVRSWLELENCTLLIIKNSIWG